MSRKWLGLCIVATVASSFLVWAFPRLHPAARLSLQFDRQGYLQQARNAALRNGADVAGWRGYAQLDTQRKNQDLHRLVPGNQTAAAFPEAQVETNFLPLQEGSGAKVTLRIDGRPLGWKLPVPAKASSDAQARVVAQNALREIAGADVDRFVPDADQRTDSDGVTYRWTRSDAGAELPAMIVEVSVRNGRAWRAHTDFSYPQMPKGLNAVPIYRATVSTLWFVLLLPAIVVPVLREGGGATARALKDRSSVRLSMVAAAVFTVTALLEWDDEMISVSTVSGVWVEILSVVLGGVMIGLMFYMMSAATALNARVHAARIRGFRLLGSAAFLSRNTAMELLGGWLAAPAVVATPLLLGAITRAPLYKGYSDSFPLVRWPVMDALSNAAGQETITVLGLLGVLVPLANRWFRTGWLRWAAMGVFATITFSMLNAPFREPAAMNVVSAVIDGAIMLALYANFGVLAALSAHCSSRILISGAVLLVQPAAGLHASGWEILLAFGALGVAALVVTTRGPEAVAELYAESSARLQARSRREELLAEFNVARSAQQQMLPSKPPVLEGYSISASCEPAREVGGDLYDFLRLRDGRWGIGVADVSGKGVPAALYMTLTKGLLCAAAQESDDPKQILGAVNRHLRTVTKRKMFVTMAMGVLDPAERRMEYVRAGHNPVVWRRRDARETRLLAGAGIGLGIAGPALFGKTLTAEILELGPGDAIVFYSDGLTEAMNGVLEQFGEERLIAAVESADGMHAEATRDSILREVKQFLGGGHSQDDLTIAVLRVNADLSNGR